MKLKLFLLLLIFLPEVILAQNLTTRTENEVMFAIDNSQVEPIWSFLKQRFAGENITVAGNKLRGVESIEWFKDDYFDTFDKKLLKQWAGLRHRSRIGEKGMTKDLIQLKLTPFFNSNKEDQNRSEVKFKMRKTEDLEKYEDDDKNTLLHITMSADKPRLKSHLKELGVNAEELKDFMTLTQERRRIYFRTGDKQLFTATVDITSGGKYWLKGSFSQLELEISEIALTTGSEEDVKNLFAIQQEIKKAIDENFPNLKQDQAPKMVKMYDQISSRGFVQRMILTYGAISILIFFLIIVSVIIASIWLVFFKLPLLRASNIRLCQSQ